MMSVLLFYLHNDVISFKQEQENRIESNIGDTEKQTCINEWNLNPSVTQFVHLKHESIVLFLTKMH